MLKVIKYPKAEIASEIKNDWQLFRSQEGEEAAALPFGKVIVPFSWWLARGHRPEFLERAHKGQLGIWFSAHDDVLAHAQEISSDFSFWALIAIDFPIFRDGRGLSTAALLRERFGWTGYLRAVGDVLIDQLLPMSRVGFDQFELRHDQDVEVALSQFSLFPVNMQNDWRSQRAQLSGGQS